MRILITGGNGFIGRNLVQGLCDSYDVHAPQQNQLNLLDSAAVRDFLKKGRFDIVIHAATWNATRVSNKDISLTLDRNLRMYFNLIRERECFGRLITFGSGAEFSRNHWHGKMAEDEVGLHVPIDDYGLSKLIISRYSENFSNILNLRLFAVFGPYEDWRIRFISNNACRGLFDLPLKIKQDRCFDFLHVDDVVSAVRQSIRLPALSGNYNLCRGKGQLLSVIAKMIMNALRKDLPVEIHDQGEGLEYSGDNRRIIGILSEWFPTDIESGIKQQVQWLKRNLHSIKLRELESYT